MAKVKNKRNSGLADRVNNKKKGDMQKKKLNPFEVHINREKLKVLGKKSKHDRGLPGVSRAKAIQKRKETLGTEMKLMNKTNTFIDKRIGEKDSQLSSEDRIVARYAAERAKHYKKKDIYNLADDEILTHRGQTLEQIEKFDDPRSDDEEDDDGRKFGGLDNEFVAEGHFGGGVLSKTDSKDGAKSHKDLIEQLIAESKKRKAEKQREKEQTLDLTDKLDTEWKDLQPVVFKRPRVEEQTLIDKLLGEAEKKNQDYDKMMRELKFDRRGTPSDGLKSEEKQLKEEQKRLDQLEREREQRMLGEEGDSKRTTTVVDKHRSADDLDDNFELDNEQEFMLAYDKDGNPLVPDHILKANHVPNAKQKYEDGISDSSSNDEDDDEEDDEESDENDEEQDQSQVEKESEKQTILFQKGDDKESSDESSDDNNDESDKDNTIDETTKSKEVSKIIEKSDAKVEKDKGKQSNNMKSIKVQKSKEKTVVESDESSSGDDEIDDSKAITIQEKSKKTVNKTSVVIENTDAKDKINNKNEIKNKKPSVVSNVVENNTEKDVQELSSDDENSSENNDDVQSSNGDEKDDEKDKFDDLQSESESGDDTVDGDVKEKLSTVFDDKSSECDNLRKLLKGKNPTEHATALKQLIKTYDPSLAVDNKEILSRLFAHLLQYINEIFTNLTIESEIIKSFLIFDKIAPFLYDLAHMNKVSSKKYLADVIKEKREDFFKNSKRIPDLDTLIFLKLVSLIYPTSDYQHPVATPSFIFMSEMLTLSRFIDVYSISRGLFITALVLEYTVLSKRLLPAALNFIRGVLFLAANTSILNPIQIIPPFKMHKDVKFLILEDDCSKLKMGNKMAASDLVLNSASNEFKIRCLSTSVDMLKEFFDNASEYSAQSCLFEPHLQLLGRIDLEVYPKKLRERIKGAMDHMKQSLEMKTYTPMSKEKKRPKALRLYEPDVQEVFTGSKSAKLSREMAEKMKLEHKYKKEMKGALREIRRDKAYIAAVKIRQKIHNDQIRKEKVKQIYKDASVQQGELNKLKRMK